MFYQIHYSKNLTEGKEIKNPTLLEMMSDVWKYAKIEADTEDKAIEEFFIQEGKERVNYILSVEPVNA